LSKDGQTSHSELPNLHQKSLQNKKKSRLFKVTYERQIAPTVIFAPLLSGGRNEKHWLLNILLLPQSCVE
jgi:hypothetical protein